MDDGRESCQRSEKNQTNLTTIGLKIQYKKLAPTWDWEPQKALLVASVVFTPARGSSILASLSEAGGYELEKPQAGPFLLLAIP